MLRVGKMLGCLAWLASVAPAAEGTRKGPSRVFSQAQDCLQLGLWCWL